MNFTFLLARRYLFARKSHNVINLISAASAVGIAVGTAALTVILSVYNGFDALVKSMMTSVEPDFVIVPESGKFFTPEQETLDWLKALNNVEGVCRVLQDNVFASYEGHQGTVLLKGVDSVYESLTPLRACLTDGEWTLRHGEIPYAAVGAGFANTMGINVHFVSPLELFYPKRGARLSPLNPLASVEMVKVWPSGEFSVTAEVDARLAVTGMETARRLFGLESEVSALEIRLADGTSPKEARRIGRLVENHIGAGLSVLDRSTQNPALYKMLLYEKLSVFLIMLFIVIILGFSIFGSLSMLIMEKKDDIFALSAMGAEKTLLRRIFTIEGWMISLVGMAVGMIVGVAFCLLQQRFGFIRMPGVNIVDAYPVALQASDLAVSALAIALSGYLIALIPPRRMIL